MFNFRGVILMENMKKMLLAVVAALSLGTVAVAHKGCEQAPVETSVAEVEAPVVDAENVVEEAPAPTDEASEASVVEEEVTDVTTVDEAPASDDEVDTVLNEMAK